jgi:hypothetical protein
VSAHRRQPHQSCIQLGHSRLRFGQLFTVFGDNGLGRLGHEGRVVELAAGAFGVGVELGNGLGQASLFGVQVDELGDGERAGGFA